MGNGVKHWSVQRIDTGTDPVDSASLQSQTGNLGSEAADIDAHQECLVIEEPMEIRVHDEPIAVVMRTPGFDHALAAGFMYTEGIVAQASHVALVKHCARVPPDQQNNVVQVVLKPGIVVQISDIARRTYAGSSCGVCGKSTMASIFVRRPPLEDPVQVTAAVVASLSETLRAAQTLFDATGGLHAAGLFDRHGELLHHAEDVGRHNAVDKVVGRAVPDRRLPLKGCILKVSGRLSFEIVQKAHVAGIPVVAAVSAPSSMAVEFADVSNQTLIAFSRNGRFNVYTHPHRVI